MALALAGGCAAGAQDIEAKIDAYVRPYVESRNFSGVVLVEQGGRKFFEHAYGMADREHGVANTWDTRFHIASVSMQYTAAAILRLVDQGKLSLDEHVDAYAPQITDADKIRVRDLLTERSGIPDINALPEYNDLLQRPQTAQGLVAKVSGRPLLFEPGTKYLHEEHSAYNVLALILEKKTGLPFAEAVRNLVLKPAGLKDTFIDDDGEDRARKARGYEPEGVDGLKDATAIHWSAKSGNASVCTTARDQARLVRALAKGTLLSRASREAMFDESVPVGYGWFKRNTQLGEMAYSMNGRAPGFSSFVVYVPGQDITVVVFSNIYSSATTAMGYDVAKIVLGRDYEPLKLGATLGADELKRYAGTFAFGEDFYQKNARLELKPADGYLALLWPSGDASPLIPAGKDRFIDRSYWETVTVERVEAGAVTGLRYGEFRGKVVGASVTR
jgi:CubicO group peptidase (beta-lactamase class C family)